ncbi:MAG: hypothetical protein WD749_11625 [Phycisphaerales bacterium]
MTLPAAVITEKLSATADPEAKAIQKEARERFKAGKGIRVFSRPERLKEWCEANGVDIEARCGLITDAGRLVPEFSLAEDGVEFFVHSPFAMRQDENTVVDRNCDCLVMHATFEAAGAITKLMLTADVTHDVISDIVRVTEARGNVARLEWDIFKLPHHCSYLSLSDERGVDKTKPVLANDIRGIERVAAVFEASDRDYPEVLALRNDFPLVLHLNQREREFPRSLCLYDRVWAEVRVTWTAPAFLERVRWWLAGTAQGSLHGDDQQLEPLLVSWGYWLVLPPNEEPKDRSWVVHLVGGERGKVFIAREATASARHRPAPCSPL